MSRKLTQEKVEKRFLKKGFVLLSEYNGSYKLVNVKCHCGKIFRTKPLNIFYGHKSSCGCLFYQYRKRENNYLWSGFGEISGSLWKAIIKNAKKRNIVFNLSIEDAWSKFLSQNKSCIYTGEKIIFAKQHKFRNQRTASLDRINSSKGYMIDNIQWIHKDINEMKWDLEDKIFMYYVNLIVNPIKQKSKNIIIIEHNHKNWKGFGNVSGHLFSRIKLSAKKRNIDFFVSIKDLWNKFLEQNGLCALTGLDIKIIDGTASLDRIDSKKGYMLNNIQWIHKDINNKIKKHYSEEKLKKICLKILKHRGII